VQAQLFNKATLWPFVQAELPFKSKPKEAQKRSKPSYEQRRRVVVREPGEKQAASLVHALNAIRNAKAEKRREQQTRRRKVGSPVVYIVLFEYLIDTPLSGFHEPKLFSWNYSSILCLVLTQLESFTTHQVYRGSDP
jgi:hypothetical protein